MQLSVIIPLFNESKILLHALEEFSSEFDEIVGKDAWHFLLVENGSADNTLAIVQEYAKDRPATTIIQLSSPNYGNALREGILAAQCPWCMILNIDHLWDKPYFTWSWKFRHGYDIIMGSKGADPSINRQTKYRNMLSTGLNALLRYFLQFTGSDSHGMKVMQTDTIKPLAEICVMRRGQFDTELTIRALRKGLRIAEIPIPYEEKRAARNYMVKKIGQNVIDLFRFVQVMKTVQYENALRYRRFSREDIINGTGI